MYVRIEHSNLCCSFFLSFDSIPRKCAIIPNTRASHLWWLTSKSHERRTYSVTTRSYAFLLFSSFIYFFVCFVLWLCWVNCSRLAVSTHRFELVFFVVIQIITNRNIGKPHSGICLSRIEATLVRLLRKSLFCDGIFFCIKIINDSMGQYVKTS